MGAHSALTVLTRLAARHPEHTTLLDQALQGRLERLAALAMQVAFETGDPMGTVLAAAIRREATPELAETLRNRLPTSTVALREAAVEIERRSIQRFDEDGAGGVRHQRAVRFHALAVRLDQAGRFAEAMQAAQLALDDARSLAAELPGWYDELLATVMSEVGELYQKVNDEAQAWTISMEALAISRNLFAKDPQTHRRTLAVALVNAALRTGNSFLETLAPPLITEGVAMWRQVAAASGADEDQESLASALGNLVHRTQGTDSPQATAKAAREAVEIYVRLADRNPDGIGPRLASARALLGTQLLETGDIDAALAELRQAVDAMERISLARPDLFDAQLAGARLHLAQALKAKGMPLQAQTTLLAGMKTLRRLSAERPDVHVPRLTAGYELLGQLLFAQGRDDEALLAWRTAIAIYTRLFVKTPLAHPQTMARLVTGCLGRAAKSGADPQPLHLLLVEVFEQIVAQKQKDPESIVTFAKAHGKDASFYGHIFNLLIDEARAVVDEPVVGHEAASMGVWALWSWLEQGNWDAARESVQKLLALWRAAPDDPYLVEELGVAWRYFGQAASRDQRVEGVLEAHARLVDLCSAVPASAALRRYLANLAISVIPIAPSKRDAIAAHDMAWRDVHLHPHEPELAVAAAKSSFNLVRRLDASLDADALELTLSQLRATAGRLASEVLRTLLAKCLARACEAMLHAGRTNAAFQLNDEAWTLAQRFSDEDELIEPACDSLERLSTECVCQGDLATAYRLYRRHCEEMPSARRCRLARAFLLRVLCAGEVLRKDKVHAGRLYRELDDLVSLEGTDEDFAEQLAVARLVLGNPP